MQFGRVPLDYARLIRRENLYSDARLSYRGNSVNIVDSDQVVFTHEQFKPSVRDLKIDAVLLNKPNWTKQQQASELEHYGGSVQDLIGYAYVGCECPDINHCNCSCSCGTGGYGCKIVWMHTRAKLTDIRRSRQTNHKQIELGLSFDLLSYWMPLNAILWKFDDTGWGDQWNPPGHDFEVICETFPGCEALDLLACNDLYRWHRHVSIGNIMFKPWVWDRVFDCQPQDDVVGKNGDWTSGIRKDTIYAWRDQWSQRPHSMYALRYLTPSGDSTIRVLHEDEWGHKENFATITHSKVNSILNTVTGQGLGIGDKIIVGSIQGDAVVQRGGDVVARVPSAVSYNSEWIGGLHPGKNIVVINTPGQSAFLHQFRSY